MERVIEDMETYDIRAEIEKFSQGKLDSNEFLILNQKVMEHITASQKNAWKEFHKERQKHPLRRLFGL